MTPNPPKTEPTLEEKRVRIAEACGWTEVHEAKRHHDSPSIVGLHPMQFGSGSAYLEIPDYFHDLNAMAEAEKVLDGDKCEDASSLRYRYAGFLYNICVPLNQQPCRATAAQRATAFGLTLGLW